MLKVLATGGKPVDQNELADYIRQKLRITLGVGDSVRDVFFAQEEKVDKAKLSTMEYLLNMAKKVVK
jgi:hypothetical protein